MRSRVVTYQPLSNTLQDLVLLGLVDDDIHAGRHGAADLDDAHDACGPADDAARIVTAGGALLQALTEAFQLRYFRCFWCPPPRDLAISAKACQFIRLSTSSTI